MYLGSSAAMLVLPFIASAFGPRALLSTVGTLGILWTLCWSLLHRRIQKIDSQELPIAQKAKANRDIPWMALISSTAIWTIVANNFAFHYSVYVVMNWLPTYFTELIGRELGSIGTVKSVPYLMMFATAVAGGYLGDLIILRWKLSVASGRKLINTFGFALAAFGLILMPTANNILSGVLCTTVVMGALGFSRGGWAVNHMDVAPRYAGIVMGISNTAGTISGVVGVATTGAILSWNGGAGNWRGWSSAFGVAAAVGLSGAAMFVRSAKGERLFD